MAAYISVPRDLTRVKAKVMFNLTRRQLLCFGAAAVVGLPVFFGLRILTGNNGVSTLAMMIVMMPLFFLAMYEKNGQPMEKVAKHFIDAKFRRPKVRPYRTNNYYAVLARQAQLNEEVERIVCSTEKVAGTDHGKGQR